MTDIVARIRSMVNDLAGAHHDFRISQVLNEAAGEIVKLRGHRDHYLVRALDLKKEIDRMNLDTSPDDAERIAALSELVREQAEEILRLTRTQGPTGPVRFAQTTPSTRSPNDVA